MSKQVTWIVPSVIEAQISGAKYAQISAGKVKLTYLDDTTESRKRTDKPLPESFLGLFLLFRKGGRNTHRGRGKY